MNKRLTDLSPYYKSTNNGYIRLTYEQVIIDLQNSINKAIEYIEEFKKMYSGREHRIDMRYFKLDKLLDILKGVDKE